MTRMDETFLRLKEKNEKALIPFFFAGDPDMDTTFGLVLAAQEAGADVVELGIPYSDPLADGPVNQQASARALKNGANLKDIFSLVRRLRQKTQTPLVFLLYFNCILQYGIERFLSDCAGSGVDGLVIPDLPYEERAHVRGVFDRYPVDIAPLVTPASKQRISSVVDGGGGFVYCVTSPGVTGVRGGFDTDFDAFMEEVGRCTGLPRVLGFGISTPAQARRLKAYAEGVIVGSAVVRLIADSNRENLLPVFSRFIGEMKDALR